MKRGNRKAKSCPLQQRCRCTRCATMALMPSTLLNGRKRCLVLRHLAAGTGFPKRTIYTATVTLVPKRRATMCNNVYGDNRVDNNDLFPAKKLKENVNLIPISGHIK